MAAASTINNNYINFSGWKLEYDHITMRRPIFITKKTYKAGLGSWEPKKVFQKQSKSIHDFREKPFKVKCKPIVEISSSSNLGIRVKLDKRTNYRVVITTFKLVYSDTDSIMAKPIISSKLIYTEYVDHPIHLDATEISWIKTFELRINQGYRSNKLLSNFSDFLTDSSRSLLYDGYRRKFFMVWMLQSALTHMITAKRYAEQFAQWEKMAKDRRRDAEEVSYWSTPESYE